MTTNPKISIYTPVYNTERFVRRCVESVLSQSYANFEYLVLDNGCTDGCSEILREYAARDERIKLIRLEENQYGYIGQIFLNQGDGEYVAFLDSDDWLEPDFLKKLVKIAVANELDIVCAGSYTNYHGSTEQQRFQKRLFRSRVIRPENYQAEFLNYLPYLGVLWGKIVRMDLMRRAFRQTYIYSTMGIDTVICFNALRMANGLGIVDGFLHHYLRRSGSVSVSYHQTMFDGEAFCCKNLTDFLKEFGPPLPQNLTFVRGMLANGMATAIDAATSAAIPLDEELAECQRILEEPLVQEVFRYRRESGLDIPLAQTLKRLLDAVFRAAPSDEEIAALYPKINAIFKAAAPDSYRLVSPQNLRLFFEDTSPIRARLGGEKIYQTYVYHHRTSLLFFSAYSPLRFIPGNETPLLQLLASDEPKRIAARLKKIAKKRGLAREAPQSIKPL